MMSFFQSRGFKILMIGCAVVAVIIGVVLRLYHLSSSGFFFYDEGLYLNFDLASLEFIRMNPPQGFIESWHALLFYLNSALASGKSLWFLVIDSRFLIGGIHNWAYAKYAAAFFGILSLPLVYAFAKRYYRSKEVAWLALIIMTLLPGAIFYSRIALQEAFSIFLVLAGLYCYFFPRAFGWRTALSGVLLAAAFFSNYRLLMLPMIVMVVELWFSLVEKNGGGLRKFVWFCVVFFSCVLLIGSLMDAANLKVIFAWVFHQQQTAGVHFSWINLLSYPYYFFRLETWLFALLFFGNIYFIVLRRWAMALPFVLVLVQMAIFSLTAEKGVRYIAVMLPFAVMAVAALIWELFRGGRREVRIAAVAVGGLMLGGLLVKSIPLAQASSAHVEAVHYVQSTKGEEARFFSSQEMVDMLYPRRQQNVKPVPPSFDLLSTFYDRGYRTLVLDPQAYVSLCQGEKFTRQLRDYLGYIEGHLEPVKVFPHMNQAFLERFVLEHSENLAQSVRFLAAEDIAKISTIRIYDLDEAIPAMKRFVAQWQMLKRK